MTYCLSDGDAAITVQMIARGLVDVYEQINEDGSVVQQDATLPQSARRALARLSRHCLEDGVEDFGSSIHLVMHLAGRPISQWEVPTFEAPFRYAEVELANAEFGVPTADCRELARLGGSELDAVEDLHHEALRAAVNAYPASRRHSAYAAIREFVVRNPAVSFEALNRFIVDGHVHAARAISGLYRTVPQSALTGGTARTCGRCGALLWPDRDPAYPNGRCRSRRCRQEGDTISGQLIPDPATWRVAAPAVLAYWVGPGLDEIALHDTLAAAGREPVLYPQADAADVGLDGLAVGIDLKNYASPLLLGSRLTRSIGRLGLFARRIIAVPDYKLRLNRHYLDDLRGAYRGDVPLEFASMSQIVAEFGR